MHVSFFTKGSYMRMKLYAFLVLLAITLRMIYKRYVPVYGIKKLDKMLPSEEITLIDVREYNEVYYTKDASVLHMPIPYLGRNYRDIPTKQVAIIASDRISRNVSIRELRKYGFQVIGFYCVAEREVMTKRVATSTCS